MSTETRRSRRVSRGSPPNTSQAPSDSTGNSASDALVPAERGDGFRRAHARAGALLARRDVDPDELLRDPMRAVLSAAGVDLVELTRQAAEVLVDAMSSDDLDSALRASDQVWRIVAGRGGSGGGAGSGVTVPVQINIAPFAKPVEAQAIPASDPPLIEPGVTESPRAS